MIDSRNINVIRSNVRDMKAETGANTTAVLELETLVGATPLPTGQTTITGAIKYLDEKPSGGGFEQTTLFFSQEGQGITTSAVDIDGKYADYDIIVFVFGRDRDDGISSQMFLANMFILDNTKTSINQYDDRYMNLQTKLGETADAFTISGVKDLKLFGIYGLTF